MKAIEHQLEDFMFESTPKIIEILVLRVKELRKKKKLTQEKFAAHIGMSFGTYKKFETANKISFEGFIDICRGLGKIEDISELLKPDTVEEVGIKIYKTLNK
ncbi:MAG: helix-turn-helix transcriptional regulator [Sulfurimonas sp.]|nr:helix-turn-helix transcriptional regulator [Sulfurimonas sp.]